MRLDDAIKYVFSGQAILFVGAGFSIGATNLRGHPFKLARDFAEHLNALSGLKGGYSLQDSAEWFSSKVGAEALIGELHHEFTAKEVTAAQVNVIRCPWRRIYTTNYDNVVELAGIKVGKRILPAVLDEEPRALPKGSCACVHLNGFVERISADSLEEDIRLTDTSYVTSRLSHSAWATTFRQDLQAARVVFFIGYSLADLDISRLIPDTELQRAKTFFSIGTPSDSVALLKLGRLGEVIGMSGAELGSRLNSEAQVAPDSSSSILRYCFRTYVPAAVDEALDDRRILQLFLYGDIRENFVWSSLHEGTPYVVDCTAAEQAVTWLDSGHQVALLVSDMGNGKSAALEIVKAKAADRGMTVYSLVEQADSIFTEFQQILDSTEKVLVVIDNYPNWLDAVSYFGQHASRTAHLVLTSRTSVHEVLGHRLDKALNGMPAVEIDVDIMSESDMDSIVAMFDRYGLWGELASLSHQTKRRLIANKWQGQWRNILLDRLASPQIRERISPLIRSVAKTANYYKVVMTCLILTVLDYRPTINLLTSLNGEAVLQRGFRQDSAIAELIDFSSGEARIKSSILGQYILTHFANSQEVVDVLVEMIRASDLRQTSGGVFPSLTVNLMRTQYVQSVLPLQDRNRAFLSYYERIKDIPSAKGNPLFWLQYAIASTIVKEFVRAEKYFGTSYSYANERPGFNTYQIDNHFARFLLMRAIHDKTTPDPVGDFRKARSIILSQIKSTSRHYPFNVASSIAEFYEVYFRAMSEDERGEILDLAQTVLDEMSQKPAYLQNHRYVRACKRILDQLLKAGGR